jgi:hypothetical protein
LIKALVKKNFRALCAIFSENSATEKWQFLTLLGHYAPVNNNFEKMKLVLKS